MYEKQLKELGLTDNETNIYLTLLKFGALNPTQLAKKTGLHRSYIYDTTEKLLEKGIINTILIKNKKHFQPVNPKILKQQLEIKLDHLNNIIPNLTNLFKATKEPTRVELHKGKRVYRTLIKDVISTLRKDNEALIIGIDENILINEIEPIYLKQYLNIIKRKNIKERIIIKKGSKKLKHKNIKYKELEKEYIGNTAQIIYQDKVAIFILGTPLHLIIIENKQVAQTYRKQFELMWKK